MKYLWEIKQWPFLEKLKCNLICVNEVAGFNNVSSPWHVRSFLIQGPHAPACTVPTVPMRLMAHVKQWLAMAAFRASTGHMGSLPRKDTVMGISTDRSSQQLSAIPSPIAVPLSQIKHLLNVLGHPQSHWPQLKADWLPERSLPCHSPIGSLSLVNNKVGSCVWIMSFSCPHPKTIFPVLPIPPSTSFLVYWQALFTWNHK